MPHSWGANPSKRTDCCQAKPERMTTTTAAAATPVVESERHTRMQQPHIFGQLGNKLSSLYECESKIFVGNAGLLG